MNDISNQCFLSTQLNVSDFLIASAYIDVEVKGVWHVAEILQVSDTEITVQYKGFPPEIAAERIKLPSTRLSFFRSRTKSLTDNYIKAEISLEKVDTLHKQLNKLIEDYKKDERSAHTITQIIRGDMYFCIESMLTCFVNKAAAQNVISKLFVFFKLVSELIEVWSKEFTRADYELSFKYPNLYLVSSKVALLDCFPELTNILKLMFELNKRTEEVLKVISSELKKSVKDIRNTEFYTIFKESGIPALKNIITKNIEGVPVFPIRLILKFIEPFKDIQEARELIIGKLEERFYDLCAKEDKDEIINELTIQNFVEALDPLFTGTKGTLEKIKDKIIIDILNTQEQLNYTISQLTTLLDYFKKDINLPSFFIEDQSKVDKTKLNVALRKIKSFDFITLLFQKNCIFELIRDNQDIIKLLAMTHNIDEQGFKIIWNTYTTDDLELKRLVARIVKLIGYYASSTLLKSMFTLINAFQRYDQFHLEFLYSYTFNVLTNIYRECDNTKKINELILSTDGILYDSETFWKLMLSGDKQLSPFAMKYLVTLCSKTEPLASKYIELSIEIVKGPGTIIILKFLKSLYMHLQNELKTYKDLFKSLIDELIFYKCCFRPVKYLSFVKGVLVNGVIEKDIMSYVLF